MEGSPTQRATESNQYHTSTAPSDQTELLSWRGHHRVCNGRPLKHYSRALPYIKEDQPSATPPIHFSMLKRLPPSPHLHRHFPSHIHNHKHVYCDWQDIVRLPIIHHLQEISSTMSIFAEYYVWIVPLGKGLRPITSPSMEGPG
jgi:hypothetical protein